jgi:hypothetical protein
MWLGNILWSKEIKMKQKFYNNDIELTLADEFLLANYYMEYPVKKDYIVYFSNDPRDSDTMQQYMTAKDIYKKLSKIFKDKEISVIAMLFQNMSEGEG